MSVPTQDRRSRGTIGATCVMCGQGNNHTKGFLRPISASISNDNGSATLFTNTYVHSDCERF